MPMNSIQTYVAGLLDQLPIPGTAQVLDTSIVPPTVDNLDNPKAYVLASRMDGSRQTMPRINVLTNGSGYKKLLWNVDVYLTYETNPDDIGIDQEFPLIIDAVMLKLWTTTMPLSITDPTTNLVSQVLAIGERFDVEYPPERTPATLRMLLFTARIGFTVEEAVQF